MHKTYILTDNTHSKIVDRIASVLPQTDHPVVMTPMKYMFENEDAANFALLILIVDSLDTQTLNTADYILKQKRTIQFLVVSDKFSIQLAKLCLHYHSLGLFTYKEVSDQDFIDSVHLGRQYLYEEKHRQGIVTRQLLRDILKGKIPTSDEIYYYFQLKKPACSFIFFLIKRDYPIRLFPSTEYEIEKYYQLNWHDNDFPQELGYLATVNTLPETWCSLLYFRKDLGSLAVNNISQECVRIYQHSFHEQTGDTVSVYYSLPFQDFQSICREIETASETLSFHRRKGRARICSSYDHQEIPSTWPMQLERMKEEVSGISDSKDQYYIRRVIDNALSEADLLPLPFSAIQEISIYISVCLTDVSCRLRVMSLEERIRCGAVTEPKCYSVKDLRAWFSQAVGILFSSRYAVRECFEDERIDRIANYVFRHISDVTIQSISEAFDISESHLRHLFKKHTGLTLISYITQMRIHYAMELLEISDYKVTEVSKLAGFSSSQYFSSVFLKAANLTPSEYRKKYSYSAMR